MESVYYKNKIRASFDFGRLEYDKTFIKEIWEDGYYFKNGFEIKKGMKVLDVGGHVGLFAVLAEALGAEVVTIEPLVEHYKLLCKNIYWNGSYNITPVFGALTPFSGVETLNVPKKDIPNRNSGKTYIGGANSDFDAIPTITYSTDLFFELFGDDFDYLKLDCEGGEYPILYTMNTDILKRFKFITMEFHGEPEKGRQLEKFLQQCGFETFFAWSYGEQGRLQAKNKI